MKVGLHLRNDTKKTHTSFFLFLHKSHIEVNLTSFIRPTAPGDPLLAWPITQIVCPDWSSRGQGFGVSQAKYFYEWNVGFIHRSPGEDEVKLLLRFWEGARGRYRTCDPLQSLLWHGVADQAHRSTSWPHLDSVLWFSPIEKIEEERSLCSWK